MPQVVLRGRRLPRRRPLLTRHRRAVAAVLLAVATGLAVDAAASGPAAGVAVVVAAHDLPTGHQVGESDVTTVEVPRAARPDGSLTAQEVVGATLAGPVRRAEPLTDAALTGPPALVGWPAGTLALPVPLSGPAVPSLLRVGDSIALLAGPGLDDVTGTAEVVVPEAVVLAIPSPPEQGLLGDSTGGDSSGGGSGGATTVVLALDRAEATRVAAAFGQRPLIAAVLRYVP